MMGMMGNQSNITVLLNYLRLSEMHCITDKSYLSRSATTAESTVGNNSHAVAAHFGIVNGYLVYTVWVVDGSYNFHKVIVDAGNGKILLVSLYQKEDQ